MKKSVLLVEDDPFLIDIYAAKLKEADYSIDIVEDGEATRRKLQEKTPDVIVLDLVLPKIDGWEILKEIKADSKLSNIPVVILSNLGQKSEVERGLAMGATKYLIKAHYTPSEVIEEIKKVTQ
ncbi:MAG: response regulator [Candidatus Pacebacteria bacterium]|nr:response regulator [Candidatus Paceibacterota bacterium]